MRGLFLDTATQIARHWHCEREQKEISSQLDGHSLYCSWYVKCQYRATLLNSIIYLYALLLHHKDLNKALRAANFFKNIDITGGKLTQAVQKRIIEVGLWLLEYREYDEQKLRLEDLIEDGWETFFHAGIRNPLIDETSCLYASGVPEMGDSGAYKPIEVSCRKDNPPECGIKDFWSNHRIHLEVLSNMKIGSIEVETKDKEELARIKDHAKQIAMGKPPYGQQRCQVHLSDAIICIESTHCPEECAVHSTNKKHFAPLGEVLGVETEPK